MKKLIMTTLLLLSTYTLAGDKGNGGDKVFCKKNLHGHEFRIHGHLFLDKLVAHMEGYRDKELFSNIDHVLLNLRKKIPTLAIELEEIYKAYTSKSKRSKFVWSKGRPIDIKDENLLFELPLNCKDSLKQTVIRTRYNPERAYFKYSEKEMKNLSNQLSWVLLHELLWDYYDNADEIRLVNIFFHQKEFSKLSSVEYLRELNRTASKQHFISFENYNRYNGNRITKLIADLEKEDFSNQNDERKELIKSLLKENISLLIETLEVVEDPQAQYEIRIKLRTLFHFQDIVD